jgi:toxin ParE1/3/4
LRLLELSVEAKADLLDISAYIARDNSERARCFVDELETGCADLLRFPDSGRARPELAPGLRSKPHGRYIIFYTPERGKVRIERILHGARDIEAEFGKEGRG